MHHAVFLQRCLDLAELGRGQVGNGALVGSVLVRNGKIIAEAFHEGFGRNHAERQLLLHQDSIHPEDILYVSLEPCCHFGKTPPCTDIILRKDIRTVVYAMEDPDPRVRGEGVEILRAKGVTVVGPILKTQAERLNRGFMSVRTKARPWITIKMAKDRAGSISNPDGSPRKITSPIQDAWSHTFLRSRHDAVLVGVQTVITDNPKLDTRFAQERVFKFDSALIKNEKYKEHIGEKFRPIRVVLDPHLRMPEEAHVVTDAFRNRTYIVCADSLSPEAEKKAQNLALKGVHILYTNFTSDGFEWPDLWSKLLTPSDSYHGITSILVEGGARTWEAFGAAGLADEEVSLVGA
jgi:diaminohydroxyphosphoribosylaminopyrimidine deaminase/5-amino-6-(5-phosphoribosylamino)uracil reductase